VVISIAVDTDCVDDPGGLTIWLWVRYQNSGSTPFDLSICVMQMENRMVK